MPRSRELSLWCDDLAREFDNRLTPTIYRISTAGSAFKAHALAAAGVAAEHRGRFECFRTLKSADTSDRM
ncbi:hypothetical protein [Nocardia jiangsuensis]|uniref:Uncharacterized protein n=1 Tax=Nocardia jiangsuensis TaxID=1691563 RepID=A0ABV8DPV0_9NOCA